MAPCWRSPTPPLALPRPCPLDLLRLHLSTRPHKSALHHSALAPDRITRFPRVCLLLSKYSLLFNCSFQIPRSRRLACFTTRLTILYFLCFHLIYLCVLQRSQFFNYFCSLRLLFLLRCLFVRTYFLSSHSSEALIFFSDSPLNLIPPSRIPIQNERVPSGTSTQTLPLLLFSVIRSIKEKCVV